MVIGSVARAALAACAAAVVVVLAGCEASGGAPGATASPPGTAATASASGPFRLQGSACSLLDPTVVAELAGRSSVSLLSAGSAPTGSARALLTCTFTAGVLPVGLMTIDVKPATAGRSAAQELDDTVTSGLYKGGRDEQDVPGLGDAARYGTAPAIGGLTYASVWAVRVRSGTVLGLSLTVGSHTPAAVRDGLVDLARDTLAKL